MTATANSPSVQPPEDSRMDMEHWWNDKSVRGYNLAAVKLMTVHSSQYDIVTAQIR